jgi:hypothetical protein
MKISLLEMAQDIASDLDLDYFNDIGESEESEQIARIIRQAWNHMVSNREWSRHRSLLRIEGLSDPDRPTHLKIADEVAALETATVSYNKVGAGETRLKYEDVYYVLPEDFLRIVGNNNTDDANVIIVTDVSGVTFGVRNDTAPTYWTSFDDQHLVFDSYDSNVDTTLHQSKTRVIGYKIPEFSIRNDFIPDLPADAFAGLQAEATSIASFRLKQMSDEKAEQQSQKSSRWLSRKEWAVAGGVTYEDYGRKSKRSRKYATMDKRKVVLDD